MSAPAPPPSMRPDESPAQVIADAATKRPAPIITERCVDEARPLKVIYIGAGISGIIAAIRLPERVKNLDLTIYDKNEELGGTWWENKYPGCACDIPAHSYQLSFESSTEWTSFYAGSPEILKYWQRVAEKYGIRKYMKFNKRAVEARWDDQTAKWTVKLEDTGTGQIIEDTADVVMTGTGMLNAFRWPEIKGIESFRGALLHSAAWDNTYDYKGKRVAVIGAGSSGIQVVPAIQPHVAHMDHYVRGRTWISSTFGMDLVRERNNGQDGNFDYTEEEKEKWRQDPKSYLEYRKLLEAGMQGDYVITHKGTEAQKHAKKAFTDDMRKRLVKKAEVAEHIIPEFSPLCKRLTPGPGYLEALTQDNVDVIATGISHITPTGIQTTDGKHREVDAIICATGFNTTARGGFPVYGINGQKLQDKWAKAQCSYLSMTVDGFPNYFMALGPNSGLGNGNLLILLERFAEYGAQCMEKIQTQNIRTMQPKPEAVEAFTKFCDAHFERTVFSEECSSWYKSSPADATPEEKKKGRVTALWPGSSLHAVAALSKPRWEDYDYTYVDGNRFGWFGDGWALADRSRDTAMQTFYLDDQHFLHEDLPGKKETLTNGNATEAAASLVQKGADVGPAF